MVVVRRDRNARSKSPFSVLFHSQCLLITPRGCFKRRVPCSRTHTHTQRAPACTRERGEIRSGANGKFHGKFMTYHNGGRNYRQIWSLTLYEPPKEVNAVIADAGAFRTAARDSGARERVAETYCSRAHRYGTPSILIAMIKRTIDVTIRARLPGEPPTPHVMKRDCRDSRER